MPVDKRYFAIAFDHDKDHEGNLPPASSMALTIQKPIQLKDGSVEIAPIGVTIEPIPGTRIFEVDDPVIAKALEQTPESLLIEIEKPSAKAIKDQKDQTAQHLAAIGALGVPADINPEA
jgi:hypothetical protein